MPESFALVLALAPGDRRPDASLFERLRLALPGAMLYCVAIGQAGLGPDLPGRARVVELPLPAWSRALAQGIGMQLALNEGHRYVGCARSFGPPDLERSIECFRALQAEVAGAIHVPGDTPVESEIFLSEKAAFAASFWAALDGALLPRRSDILSTYVVSIGRRAVQRNPVGERLRFTEWKPRNPSFDSATHVRATMKLGLQRADLAQWRTAPVRSVAVVTPYHREPDRKLLRCLESVERQRFPCRHYVVSDGFPNDVAKRPGVVHIALPQAHADNGNTPRYVGGLVAFAHGHDAVAYLDADNWYEPDHVESLVEVQRRTGAAVAAARRRIVLPDGHRLEAEDPHDQSKTHIDTSAYLVTRSCEFAAHVWGQMPAAWGPICDRVVFYLASRLPIAWSEKRTLNFESNYSEHYRMAGRPAPERVNDIPPDLWETLTAATPEIRQASTDRLGRVFEAPQPAP